MGWRPIPLRCPSCTQRVKIDHVILHGAAIRCNRCGELYYAVFATSIGMAFVAQLTSAEAHHMRQQTMTVAQVLDYLGARYPEEAA
jgi:uncharacterized Zn finger protein